MNVLVHFTSKRFYVMDTIKYSTAKTDGLRAE